MTLEVRGDHIKESNFTETSKIQLKRQKISLSTVTSTAAMTFSAATCISLKCGPEYKTDLWKTCLSITCCNQSPKSKKRGLT